MPRRRDLADQKERLSAATWAVLAEQGLTGLTLRAVAERAGCTTGLVLHTFRDKRALLVHARHLLHERTGRRADAIEQAGGPPERVLGALLEQAVAVGQERIAEARVWIGFVAAAVTDEDLAQVHRTHNRSFLARVGRLLRACRPERPEAWATGAATELVALVEGLNVLATADPEAYPGDVQRAAVREALARHL